ncbi:MAG: phosphonate C-P lyase system protein PhnG [Gammaproteobacteria bacterium]|nr:phosphonate C-P lyase system protein PhnG [Gammaproteobacteria bacterium]
MIERTKWVAALTTQPTDKLMAVIADVSSNWTIRPKSLPQSGLGMLKLNDSAFEDAFYLGEFPLSSAWVEIRTTEGLIAEGAAQVMDDRVDVAEALALCDAVLSAQLPGWETIARLVEEGVATREATRQDRKQILASTQVNFSLLDDVSGDDVGDDDAES